MEHKFIGMFNKYDSHINKKLIKNVFEKILKSYKRKEKKLCFRYLKNSSWDISEWEKIINGYTFPLAIFIKNSIWLSKNIKYQRPHSLGDYHSRFYRKYYELYHW